MRPIVFISVDCLRSDHLGCYGYNRPTSPNIDSFADSATVFEHAYANCPGTRWAFQSIHTGISTLKIDGLGIPEGYRPLAALFSNHGFTSGGFAVNGFVSRDYRYDTGFDTYYSVQESSNKQSLLKRAGQGVDDILRSELIREHVLRPVYNRFRTSIANNHFQPAHTDQDTVNQALSFIEEHQGESYFLWVHLMDVHTPYGYWPEHLHEIRGDADIEHTIHPGQDRLIEQGKKPPQNVIDTYDAGIRSADEQIGRLLERIPNSATIVLTGDHGEEFGRFGGFHEASLYGTMTQVPIIVRSPDLESGRYNTPAQHLDIPATLLYAGNVDVPDHWEGNPLQMVNRDLEDPVFYTLGSDRIAVRVDDWKYIESGRSGELFRVPHSQKETKPVDDEKRFNELRGLVDEYRDVAESAGVSQFGVNNDDKLSEEVKENLENLGYR